MEAVSPILSGALSPQSLRPADGGLGARRMASLARAPDEATRVAEEFERMAISQMLAFMTADVDLSEGLFGGGAGERAFRPFLNDEYARGFTQAGGIGIADAVRREILRLQEASQS